MLDKILRKFMRISRAVTFSVKEKMVKDKTSIVLAKAKRSNVMSAKVLDIFI